MLTTPDTRTEIHSMGVSRIGVVETQELGIAATMLPCAGNHLAMRSLLRIITFWLFAFSRLRARRSERNRGFVQRIYFACAGLAL
jgi:hypothetical protein